MRCLNTLRCCAWKLSFAKVSESLVGGLVSSNLGDLYRPWLESWNSGQEPSLMQPHSILDQVDCQHVSKWTAAFE